LGPLSSCSFAIFLVLYDVSSNLSCSILTTSFSFPKPKPTAKEPEKEPNSSWFSKEEPKKVEVQSSEVKEDTKSGKSWFGLGKEKEVVKIEQDKLEDTSYNTKKIANEQEDKGPKEYLKQGRQFELNIDPNPRSRKEMNNSKKKTIDIVKRMGSRVRELNNINEAGDEELLEKKKDMKQIKSARSFFKEGAKRAQSMGGVPRVKLVSDEDFESPFSKILLSFAVSFPTSNPRFLITEESLL
jgi:hypothetical protein